MSMTGDPDDHDHEHGPPEDLRAAFDQLLERYADFSDDLRQIGLYVEGHGPQMAQIPTPMGLQPAMVLQCTIGKIAFSDRVQNPDRYQMDKTFDVLEINATDDAFLDERKRIADALARGEDPYAVEDDDGLEP